LRAVEEEEDEVQTIWPVHGKPFRDCTVVQFVWHSALLRYRVRVLWTLKPV
jgi:hypothetical protein